MNIPIVRLRTVGDPAARRLSCGFREPWVVVFVEHNSGHKALARAFASETEARVIAEGLAGDAYVGVHILYLGDLPEVEYDPEAGK